MVVLVVWRRVSHFGQGGAHGGIGAELGGLHPRGSDVEGGGDFRSGEPGQAQLDDAALALRQVPERTLHGGFGVSCERLVFGKVIRVGQFNGRPIPERMPQAVEREVEAPLPVTVDDRVMGDGEQPASEGRAGLALVDLLGGERLEHPLKDAGGGVLGGFW